MPLITYNTGTASVDADATTVTGVGTIWTGGNAREGDEFVIGGSRALITSVVSATELAITPWPGSSVSGAAYTIYQTSSRRFDDVQIADDLHKQVMALNNAGYFHFVPAGATAPDPSLGDENQLAFQASSGKFWQKQSGVWVVIGSPYGLQPAQNLADLADPSAARSNLGATSVGDALFTVSDAAVARGNLGTTGVVRAQLFASSGTYTPHPDMVYAIAEGVGGGGGGGGATLATGQDRWGAGGGSGAYSRSIILPSSGPQAVTIGAGGSAGTPTSGGGGGGTSSVGTLLIAPGGGGGSNYDGSTGFGGGGAGGSPGTGNILSLKGNSAGGGGSNGSTTSITLWGIPGAPSYFGGATELMRSTSTGQVNGQDGQGPGAGGGGGRASRGGSASASGGAGAAGLVVITEFCSK